VESRPLSPDRSGASGAGRTGPPSEGDETWAAARTAVLAGTGGGTSRCHGALIACRAHKHVSYPSWALGLRRGDLVMAMASRHVRRVSRFMDGARPRAAPSGIAPGRTERAADHAVTVLYRSHYAALVRETALLVGDFATAEDVVQDCFIALHRAWWRVRDTSAAQFYLRRSMIIKSRSVLQRRVVADRHPVMSEPALPSAEEIALAVVQVSLVRVALGALPVRQREVLVLRCYADLSETQIAAVMGISRGSVKVHAARARDTLRAALADSGLFI